MVAWTDWAVALWSKSSLRLAAGAGRAGRNAGRESEALAEKVNRVDGRDDVGGGEKRDKEDVREQIGRYEWITQGQLQFEARTCAWARRVAQVMGSWEREVRWTDV